MLCSQEVLFLSIKFKGYFVDIRVKTKQISFGVSAFRSQGIEAEALHLETLRI